MPGSPRLELGRGELVQLTDRPTLGLGQGKSRTLWRAIVPPETDVRYIRADGVQLDTPPPRPTSSLNQAGKTDPSTVRVAYQPSPGTDERPIAPDAADAIARIESAHQAILRQPVDQWRLEGVRQAYEDLLKGVTDTASGIAIRERLDLLSRHEAMARDGRRIESILARSRRRDAAFRTEEHRLAEIQDPEARPYDVQGLIQASSHKVDGHRVYALIGRDGRTQAYLDIPPGIDIRPLASRRVGVRGTVHFNESLRARLISVRDIEPLDEPRTR